MTPQYFLIKKASQRGFPFGEAFFYCTFAKFFNYTYKKESHTLRHGFGKRFATPENITYRSAAYQELYNKGIDIKFKNQFIVLLRKILNDEKNNNYPSKERFFL
jgi:hypothetical protein